MFCTDLSPVHKDFLNEKIFRQLRVARNFPNNKQLRDAVLGLFLSMLNLFKGDVAESTRTLLHEQIEFADSAGRNLYFYWYLNVMSPCFADQALYEKDHGYFSRFSVGHEPLTTMLRDYFILTNNCNEKDYENYGLKDQAWLMEWFRKNADNLPAHLTDNNKDSFRGLPIRSDQDGSLIETAPVTFKQALAILAEAEFNEEQDADLKKTWIKLFRREVHSWFEVSCPYGYKWRFNKRTMRIFFNVTGTWNNVIDFNARCVATVLRPFN